MTERMLTAIANPHVDVLGHCTGRMVTGNRKRPESQFDADAVFAACAEHGVAVEVNSRPERLDPPLRLLRQAVEAGLLVHRSTPTRTPPASSTGCATAASGPRACEVPDRPGAQHLAGRAAAGLGRLTRVRVAADRSRSNEGHP